VIHFVHTWLASMVVFSPSDQADLPLSIRHFLAAHSNVVSAMTPEERSKNLDSALKQFKKTYESEMSKIAYVEGGAVAMSLLAKGAALYAGSLSGPGLVVFDGVAESLDKARSWAIGEYKASEEARFQALLARLISQHSLSASEWNQLNPRQALEYLETQNESLKRSRAGMSDLQREEISAGMLETLQRAYSQTTRYQFKADQVQNESIETLAVTLARARIELKDFVAGVATDLKEIKDSQAQLKSGLLDVQARLSQQGVDLRSQQRSIDFLNEVMFGQMTPTQQRLALEMQFVGKELTDEDRQEKIRLLKIAEARLDLETQVNRYLGRTEQILVIASALGLDPQKQEKVNQVMDIVKKGTHLASAVMSQDPLQMGVALVSIFGSGPSDAASARHAEVMAAFQKLSEGQAALGQMIGEVQKMLVDVRGAQILILQGLDQVSKQVEALQFEVQRVSDQLRVTSKQLVGVAAADLLLCEKFSGSKANYGTVDPRFGMLSYTDLVRHFENQDGLFSRCILGLDIVFSENFPRGGLNSLFNFESYFGDEGAEVLTYINKVYKPTLELLVWMKQSSLIYPGTQVVLTPLSHPSESFQELKTKSSSQFRDPPKRARFSDEALNLSDLSLSDQERMLSDLIYAPALVRLGSMLPSLLPYFSLTTNIGKSARIRDLEEITRYPWRSEDNEKVAIGYLERTIGLIDLSLAQQSILAGDVMIGPVRDLIVRLEAAPQVISDLDRMFLAKLAPVIERNGLFRENLAKQFLQDRLTRERFSRASFVLANDQWDPILMKRVLKTPFDLSRTNGGWILQIPIPAPIMDSADVKPGAISLQIPLNREFEMNGWEYRVARDHEALIRMRAELVRQVLEMRPRTWLGLNEETEIRALVEAREAR
jgi:hypothetical protein